MSTKDNIVTFGGGALKDDTLATNKNETMALLTKLLKEKSMTQADLAKQLNRDKTTVNRWCKDSREVAWDNALKIAEVLHCHPVEIYQPTEKRICKWYLDGSWNVHEFSKHDQLKYNIPYEYTNASIFLMLFDIPGSHLDGDVGIFEQMIRGKKFSRNAINRMCYIEPSKKFLTKHPNAKSVAAVLQTNNNGTFKAVSPHTRQVINNYYSTFTAEDVTIASPVIAKFNPTLKSHILTNKHIK